MHFDRLSRPVLALALALGGSVACDLQALERELPPPPAARALATEPCPAEQAAGVWEEFDVAGEGVHYFTSATIHSRQATSTGLIQTSTDLVVLTGDLSGHILYQPVSVFDFVEGTLVNTGVQVFSGTVGGGAPLLLFDDSYRFEVDLVTGATVGEIHLRPSADDGTCTVCDLVAVGTGVSEDGDALVSYSGSCRRPLARRL